MPADAARISRERQVRILLSNDDGYQARGLRTLAEHLETHGRAHGLENVEAHIAELEAAFLRVQDAMKKLIGG